MTKKTTSDHHSHILDSFIEEVSYTDTEKANFAYEEGRTLTGVTQEETGAVFHFKSNHWFDREKTSEIHSEPEDKIRRRLTDIYKSEVSNYEQRRTVGQIALETGVSCSFCAAIDFSAALWVRPELAVPIIAASTAALGFAAAYRLLKWTHYKKTKLILEKDSLINEKYFENHGDENANDKVDVFMEPQTLSYFSIRKREKEMNELTGAKVRSFNLPENIMKGM